MDANDVGRWEQAQKRAARAEAKAVALVAVKAANNAAYMPVAVSCGCGRAYVTLHSENTRETVNAVAAACKKLGLTFLRKAYGTHGPCIYIGYDNADGRALGRAKAFAAELTRHGIKAYDDAVAD